MPIVNINTIKTVNIDRLLKFNPIPLQSLPKEFLAPHLCPQAAIELPAVSSDEFAFCRLLYKRTHSSDILFVWLLSLSITILRFTPIVCINNLFL